ncbi:DUF3883 domain-containing protein [Tenacibaculum sp. TC6]|uniref:DUF3883 domain-containing protein n=1 Tax=Tenacibaculum sp. TC6 TaxID=3423223 RepID=UPI003D369626
MKNTKNKHENYEILNLLGYGLAKFDNSFIEQFGYKYKDSFYKYFVEIGIAETTGVVKNRMDLFDPFFPNKRKGWWQKGDVYLHRKLVIDSLFGNEDVIGFSNIVKLFLKEKYKVKGIIDSVKPIMKSRYKKIQETGLEAELYFINNYNSLDIFKDGKLFDARLYGDGYDFQLDVEEKSFLIEIKGIREQKGRFRLTEKEYIKANEYKTDYIITLVLNLNDIPRFLTIENPINNLKFKEVIKSTGVTKEYYITSDIS